MSSSDACLERVWARAVLPGRRHACNDPAQLDGGGDGYDDDRIDDDCDSGGSDDAHRRAAHRCGHSSRLIAKTRANVLTIVNEGQYCQETVIDLFQCLLYVVLRKRWHRMVVNERACVIACDIVFGSSACAPNVP